ncbi:MAG: hypothetical protein IT287_07015 [Bdellovibrionaceae bacterium]|nr:hypothetical protein [Pseudobdellovibrionaceae bacterium]
MKIFTFILAVLMVSSPSFADFGEIDLIVQESIENYFRENQREVDLSSMTYEKEPVTEDSIMISETAVKAIQGFTNEWGLHYCTTKVKVVSPGKYEDLGSDCFYDTDR